MMSYYWRSEGVESSFPLGTGFYTRPSEAAPTRYTYLVHKPLDEDMEEGVCFEFQSDFLINGAKAISIANAFTTHPKKSPFTEVADWSEDEDFITDAYGGECVEVTERSTKATYELTPFLLPDWHIVFHPDELTLEAQKELIELNEKCQEKTSTDEVDVDAEIGEILTIAKLNKRIS